MTKPTQETLSMLNEVLQALRMLQKIENPPTAVKDAISFLEQSVQSRTNNSLLDLMTVGDVVGYEKLQANLVEVIKLLNRMKSQGGEEVH